MIKVSFWLTEFPKTGIDANRIRGYFGNRFKDSPAYHNHSGDKILYRTPLVQYRTLKDRDQIFSIIPPNDIFHINVINNKTIDNMKIRKVDELFGISDKMISYKFITPYAINERVYREYLRKDSVEVIERSVIGNLISLSKSFDYQIKERIVVKIKKIKKVYENIRGVNNLCFYIDFDANFNIPDYMAIGKHRSIGKGVINVK